MIKINIWKKENSLVSAIIAIVVGALFIWLRHGALSLVAFIFGVLVTIDGAFRLISYIKARDSRPSSVAIGTLEVIFGILLVVFADQISLYSFIFLGAFIIFYAAMAMVKLSEFKSHWSRWVIAIFAVIIGGFLIAIPFLGSSVLNIFLIVVGALSVAFGTFSLIMTI